MAKTDSSDSVKTELIIKEEHLIEINSGEFVDINLITTKEELVERFPSESADKETVIDKKQLCEIYFSVPNEAKEYIIKEGSVRDIASEEIKKEIFVFSEDSSNENSAENKDMTKIKMEDIANEPDDIDVERDLPSEEIKKQITDDDDEDDVFSEGGSDENNPEDIGMTKFKMKDIDIEGSNIDVERNEGSSRWFQCSYCEYKTNHKKNYTRHLKHIHKIHFFSCHGCRYSTRDEESLKKHQVIHGDNTKFECPQCHKDFCSKTATEAHILRMHDNLCDLVSSKIHYCNNCSFKTIIKSRLNAHINAVHSRLEKYQCDYCLHTCFRKESLNRHISSVHLKLRQFICRDCKKTFNQKISLDIHIVSCHQKDLGLMKTVTNKIHNCDHCTFKCIQKIKMRKHIATHGKHII